MNNTNHIKRQKTAKFVWRSLKISMLTIKNIEMLEIIAIIQVNIEVLQVAYVT